MKRIYLVLITIFCWGALWGQCPSGSLDFTTQQQVDNFAANYPNCTTISGTLKIGQSWSSSDIVNLDGLSQIDTIIGNLFIRGNDSLSSLTGFENLEYIEYGISIRNNYNLIDISALENITEVSSFYIKNNPNLSECNIASICAYLSNNQLPFTIFDNGEGCDNPIQLVNSCDGNIPTCLSGGITFSTQGQIDSFGINYPNCNYIGGDVMIKGNTSTSITNLVGLLGVEAIFGRLTIQDNDMLSYLNGLEHLEIVDNGLDINNNGLINLYAGIGFRYINGDLIVRNNDLIIELHGLYNIAPEGINDLQIYGNSMLRYCNISLICLYLGYEPSNPYWIPFPHPNPTLIADNASGCNDPLEVAVSMSYGDGCSVVLPIELTHFQAQIKQKTTLLTWQTATETHNYGFEIQRSKDGTTWQKIGWQDGQGDSQTAHDYTHTDENPLSGTSYYRLKQIDFDGAFSYSDIVKVDYASSGISIYPNPVKNTLHIADLNDNTIQNITIFDQMGRQILLQNTLDVSALSSGVYIIQVVLDSGVFSDRFIVK